jgi:outer membrane scaffolding protein for murein synthesis (MipA/OmpV family)
VTWRWAAGLVLLTASTTASAQDEPSLTVGRPLLELGVAGAVGWLPDYPGSDENHVKGIAAPYLIYRGDILRADREGLRGRFFRGRHTELDVSLSGALPASSEDNEAREDMPDLDLMGEIGPDYRITLQHLPARQRVDLDLALRGVFTTDFEEITYRGLVVHPELGFRRLDVAYPGALLRVGIGPIFATGRFMDYFYDVEPRFAEAGREEFEADAGYVGSRLQGSFTVPLNARFSLIAGGRVDALWGATNRDSPLVKEPVNLSLVTGFAWSFYQSDVRSRRVEDPLD